MRTRVRYLVFIVASTVSLSVGTAASGATLWSAGLGAGSSGLAQSGLVPAAAPSGVTSACTSLVLGTTVKVSWSAVTAPSNGNPVLSYTVLEATSAGTGPYSVVQSGVAGTNWTTGSLSAGHYWFEVAAYYGANWPSVNSPATAERTITLGLLCT